MSIEQQPSLALAQEARTRYTASNPMFNRGASTYNHLMRCDIAATFAGNTILDLGTGSRGGLAHDLRDTDTTVVSFSPNAGQTPELTPPSEYLPVAGIAQQLPFRDGSFQGVVASWSIPMYLPKAASHYEAAFGEIRRVLSNKGFALLCPIEDNPDGTMQEALDKSVGEGHYLIGPPDDNRILIIAKEAQVFEQPALRGIVDNVRDPYWTFDNLPDEFIWYSGLRTTLRQDDPANSTPHLPGA